MKSSAGPRGRFAGAKILRCFERGLLLAACLAVLAPARAQEDFTTEVRLGLDHERPVARKLGAGDLKAIESVLTKRLPILGSKKGTVEARSLDDIRVRVQSGRVGDPEARMFARQGLLEFRYLEDVQTALNPRGRYLFDEINIQGDSRLRFRDRKTDKVLPLPEFLARCPLILSNEDLEPDAAQRVTGDTLMAVRVEFNSRSAKRLEQFLKKPGRLLAIVLDGEMISMNTVAERPKTDRKDKDARVQVAQIDIGGGFGSAAEAAYLAAVFNSGPLPCPLSVRSRQIVSP
jgi:preprotein translocase subunit SecD